MKAIERLSLKRPQSKVAFCIGVFFAEYEFAVRPDTGQLSRRRRKDTGDRITQPQRRVYRRE